MRIVLVTITEMHSPTDRALLLVRTIRHLRPRQVAWRLYYRFRPSPAARCAPAPPLRAVEALTAPPFKQDCLAPGPSFRFLGESRDYPEGVAWVDPDRGRLWSYNLHYFDYLGQAGRHAARHAGREAGREASRAAKSSPDGRGEDARDARSLVRDWIRANPHGEGDGWEPYPASLRIVNWVRWIVAEGIDDRVVLDSLASQVRWLERHVEHHILANHLFANAKALLYAGLAFAGDEGEAWLARGLRLVEAELTEQFLDDGGHYERSPMYHAILLDDLLDLVELGEASGRLSAERLERWRRQVARMLDWLDTMSHPDGELAFFNDAAFGIAPPAGLLAARAAKLGVVRTRTDGDESPGDAGHPGTDRTGAADGTIVHLASSGYLRLSHGPTVLLIDVAPIGPEYQPGHTHADTLSFELSIGGDRVIVNSGTSTYAPDEERHRQRSTAAHSTVEVDGRDSSEVWAGFRVARRARPFEVEAGRATDGAPPDRTAGASPGESAGEPAGALVVAAAHDGYRRLPGKVVHRRRWTLAGDVLSVVDRLEGEWRTARARFYLHPEVVAHVGDAGEGTEGGIERAGAPLARWRVRGGRARVESTTWHPRFGVAEANRCIVVDFESDRVEFELEFGPDVRRASTAVAGTESA